LLLSYRLEDPEAERLCFAHVRQEVNHTI